MGAMLKMYKNYFSPLNNYLNPSYEKKYRINILKIINKYYNILINIMTNYNIRDQE